MLPLGKTTRLQSKSSTKIICKQKHYVLGLKGYCLHTTSFLKKLVPKPFRPIWSIILEVIDRFIIPGPTVCAGDFPANTLNKGRNFRATQCNILPFRRTSEKLFVFSYELPRVPCGLPIHGKPSPVDVRGCVALDFCGTIAFTTNAGVPACIAAYVGYAVAAGGAIAAAPTRGVGAIGLVGLVGPLIATFSDAFDNIGGGISLARRFEVRLRNIAMYNGRKFLIYNPVSHGHIFLQIGIAFPTNWATIGKIGLGTFFEMKAQFRIMLDLGPLDKIVGNIIHEFKHMKKGSCKRIVMNALSVGREVVLHGKGYLHLKLRKISFGIIPDFYTTIGGVSIIVSRGGGATGVLPGVYFNCRSTLVRDLMNVIQGILDLFRPILKLLGFKRIKVPAIGLNTSLFINSAGIGFWIEWYVISAECYLAWRGFKINCRFNGKFFEMLWKGVLLVIKALTELFAKAGKFLVSMSLKAIQFTSRIISGAIKAAIGFIRNAAGAIIKVGTAAFKFAINTARRVAVWAVKTAIAIVTKAAAIARAAVVAVAKVVVAAVTAVINFAVRAIAHLGRVIHQLFHALRCWFQKNLCWVLFWWNGGLRGRCIGDCNRKKHQYDRAKRERERQRRVQRDAWEKKRRLENYNACLARRKQCQAFYQFDKKRLDACTGCGYLFRIVYPPICFYAPNWVNIAITTRHNSSKYLHYTVCSKLVHRRSLGLVPQDQFTGVPVL